MERKGEQRRAEEGRGEESRGGERRGEQSRAEQSRAEQSRAEEHIQVRMQAISHVLNKQGTEFEYLKLIEFRNEARHLEEHPKMSKFAKFEWYAFKNR